MKEPYILFLQWIMTVYCHIECRGDQASLNFQCHMIAIEYSTQILTERGIISDRGLLSNRGDGVRRELICSTPQMVTVIFVYICCMCVWFVFMCICNNY